jgi:hypothetical protein
MMCSAAEHDSDDPELFLLEDESLTSSVEMDDEHADYSSHVVDEMSSISCELPGNPVVVPILNQCKSDELECLLSAVRFNNGAAIDSIILNSTL